MAYVSDEFGRSEVFVEPFPPSGLRCQISSKGGYDPFWVADDSSIYYLSPAGELMSVTLTNLEDCAVSAPEVLFKTTVETPGTARNHFAVSSQGNILFNLPDPGSRVISVLINWPLVLPDA